MAATFKNVTEPANLSAASAFEPALIAALCALSNHEPITGNMNDTDSMPAPPINDKPRAPVSGIVSDTKPSMVGQKKQMPEAKTNAAQNAP